ncbi:MAG: hypothetical protein EBR86_01750 [Planctomycetia bacterium]|nr:hypothetical protein [Planctomycetia bacterium]
MSPTVDAVRRRRRMVVVALVGLLTIGCKPQIKLVPASGTFTIGGQPAGNITVQFMPDVSQKNSGPTSYATTDAAGRFTLRTYDNREGAVPGAHLVTAVDLEEERPAQGQERSRPVRLDAKYSMAAQGIRISVEEGKPLTMDVPQAGR